MGELRTFAEADIASARRYLDAAAAMGHAEALIELAIIEFFGVGRSF
jgi:TPR repeat protein